MAYLNNVRLKIQWAHKQFEILKNEVISYVKDNPGKILPATLQSREGSGFGKIRNR